MARPRPSQLDDDPLGPAPAVLRVGRPVPWWKQHWRAYGTYWLLFVAGCILIALGLWVRWLVGTSAEFYVATSSGLPAPAEPSASSAPISVQRAVAGPLEIVIDLARRELADPVIVTRDLAKVVTGRCEQAGLAIASRADNKLILYYKELPGSRVRILAPPVVANAPVDAPAELVDTITSVRIQIDVYLQRPKADTLLLGTVNSPPPPGEFTITARERTQGLNRQRQRFYQQAYNEVLERLRKTDMPVAVGGN